tara:strand:+ start:73 stop:549 length:477 start_codon:yes stop_codon:yes gene_type:complete
MICFTKYYIRKQRGVEMARFNPAWKKMNRAYDSKFELKLHEGVLAHCDFHTKETFDYTISHKYNPDFIWRSNGKIFLIESKGRFEDSSEASKYKHIRTHLSDDVEIIFLFQRPANPMPRAQVRKDGTKATHGEWATKQGFRWYTEETIGGFFDEERSK